MLSPAHWNELERLYTALSILYTVSIEAQGDNKTLADHFPILHWLPDQINISKQDPEKEAKAQRRKEQQDVFKYLTGCAEASWQKCEKYYQLEDESAAYYAAIVLNPTLKFEWLEQIWKDRPEAQEGKWLEKVKKKAFDLWRDEYYGKSSQSTQHQAKKQHEQPVDEISQRFIQFHDFKRLKINQSSSTPPRVDLFKQYCETNIYTLAEGAHFDVIQYWQERWDSQPDLARFALDLLAVPPASDGCERLFSSTKLLLTDQRSRLKMDIIEANECLRSWFGPPSKQAFDNKMEISGGGEEQMVGDNGELVDNANDGGSVDEDQVLERYDSDVEEIIYSEDEADRD